MPEPSVEEILSIRSHNLLIALGARPPSSVTGPRCEHLAVHTRAPACPPSPAA